MLLRLAIVLFCVFSSCHELWCYNSSVHQGLYFSMSVSHTAISPSFSQDGDGTHSLQKLGAARAVLGIVSECRRERKSVSHQPGKGRELGVTERHVKIGGLREETRKTYDSPLAENERPVDPAHSTARTPPIFVRPYLLLGTPRSALPRNLRSPVPPIETPCFCANLRNIYNNKPVTVSTYSR